MSTGNSRTAGRLLTVIILGLGFVISWGDRSQAAPRSGFVTQTEYKYPITNPLTATLVGTPNAVRGMPSVEAPLEEGLAQVRPDRKTPEVFWYIEGLPYAVSVQEGPAPIMYVIGGTGSGPLSQKMVTLKNIFFAAGYHVVLLPSPTYPSFIVAASELGMPGRVKTDVDDIMEVMRIIGQDLATKIKVTGLAVSGYSLGGLHALFVAERAERTGEMQIDRAIAVNPPISLVESVSKLDSMLEKNIPGGVDGAQEFYDRVFAEVSEFYSTTERLDFADDFLYRLQQEQDLDDPFMAGLISLSFRITLANMLFTSDVVTNNGFIKPPEVELSPADPLRLYFNATARFTFQEYVDDYLIPQFQQKEPSLTRSFLTREADLRSIEGFLRSSEKAYMVTNADDIILKPGDVEYLLNVFGSRGLVFEHGGHMGNLNESQMVAHLIAIAKGN